MVDGSIASLNVIVMSLEIKILLLLPDGLVDAIVGGVVSGAEVVVKLQEEIADKLLEAVSRTPVPTVTVYVVE